MKVKLEKRDDLLIIQLPQNYDIRVESEILALTKRYDEFSDIKNIIVDCSRLKTLESFGGEFFILEDIVTNPHHGKMFFVGLKPNIKALFDEFIKRWDKKEVNNFNTIDEVFGYLNSE
jgi:anti-anti-sigma regulatory factor